MLFWKRNFKTILVEFIDASTGTPFAKSKLVVDQLPDSFEADTTFYLNDEPWSVVKAKPMTSGEFRRTGKLTLVVQKVEHVRLDELLYSLPTIASMLPSGMAGSKLERNVLEIAEDDWRQIELISREFRHEIDREIEAIQSIFDGQQVGIGFRKIHVREAITEPVKPVIPVDDLKDALGSVTAWLDGVSYHGVAGIVVDSVAARTPSSIELYGICSAGNLRVIGLQNVRVNNLGRRDVPALADLASRYNLCLVDWCQRTVIDPEDDRFGAYFEPVSW